MATVGGGLGAPGLLAAGSRGEGGSWGGGAAKVRRSREGGGLRWAGLSCLLCRSRTSWWR